MSEELNKTTNNNDEPLKNETNESKTNKKGDGKKHELFEKSEAEAAAVQEEIVLDETKLNAYLEGLKKEQNMPMAIVGGIIGALVSGGLWAAITVATETQFVFFSIVVGIIVGFIVRVLGKGMSIPFGIIGAIFSLLGCVLGNILAIVVIYSNEAGVNYGTVFQEMGMGGMIDLVISSADFMTLLMYGLAIFIGYSASSREITEEEIIANAAV